MDTTTAAYRILALTAISGEFPANHLRQMGIGVNYGEKLITKLKEDGVLKTHYKDKLRGYRLTSRGKKMLLQQSPERFSFYLTGSCDTNRPRSDYARRLRLQQTARTYCLLANAGVTLFRDKKPALFSGTQPDLAAPFPIPVFYQSRELKELGRETTKINNSRTIGVLLTEHCVYVIFYTGDGVLKWEYKTEIRMKALLSYHMSQGILSAWYRYDTPIHALLIGTQMETAFRLMTSTGGYRHSLFTLDTSFEYFHFIPDNWTGATMLKLLCSHLLSSQLSDLLLSDLEPPDAALGLEHDATKEGIPVQLAYHFDMLRISRFLTSLRLHRINGQLICFDFQKDTLCLYCKDAVTISTIDLEKFERRFLP